MIKYVFRRLLHGLISVVIVVAIVMIMIYSLMNRDLIFAADPLFTKTANNQRIAYKYQKWEEFGYLDYVPYSDYLIQLRNSGEIDEETRTEAVKLGKKALNDSRVTKEYVKKFEETYSAKGYTVTRLDAMMLGRKYAAGGKEQLFAYKDKPILSRLWEYIKNVLTVDNIHAVEDEAIGDRWIEFTWYDPAYGGDTFCPAIIGNGTKHKYMLYFDNEFPYIHQNLLTISLGTSYTVNQGLDVFDTMNRSQGSYVPRTVYYPTGHVEESADDLHTATYVAGSLGSNVVYKERFTDNYTSVMTYKSNMSKVGFSFVIGIIATFLSYLLGLPLGVMMARRKDKLVDKLGKLYIVFISAVPSLAYIFLFKAIGGKLGLPTTFEMDRANYLMYVLPIVSLALPSIAGLMNWLRRFMIDQMNSDYVKFARSGGLSEDEIFTKHILKNAMIPIVHGIPGSILGAVVGAIITERVYVVPGAGNLLTKAINFYDNGVIVGVTLFYALITVVSIILGDVLMAMVDPRISFNEKAR